MHCPSSAASCWSVVVTAVAVVASVDVSVPVVLLTKAEVVAVATSVETPDAVARIARTAATRVNLCHSRICLLY